MIAMDWTAMVTGRWRSALVISGGVFCGSWRLACGWPCAVRNPVSILALSAALRIAAVAGGRLGRGGAGRALGPGWAYAAAFLRRAVCRHDLSPAAALPAGGAP